MWLKCDNCDFRSDSILEVMRHEKRPIAGEMHHCRKETYVESGPSDQKILIKFLGERNSLLGIKLPDKEQLVQEQMAYVYGRLERSRLCQ